MAKTFNLTAQLNLRAPNNLRAIRSQITGALSNIPLDIRFNLPANLNRSITTANVGLSRLERTLVRVNSSAATANTTLLALSTTLNRLGTGVGVNKFNNLTKANNAFGASLRKSSGDVTDFAEQIGVSFRRFSAFIIGGKAIVSFGNAISKGISEAISFQNEMVRLGQVTGKSQKQLQSVSKTISGLATGFGVSSKELSEVATTLAQAGLSAKDVDTALTTLAKTDLAPTFDNMTRSVEGYIAVQNQFKIKTEDMDKAFSAINAVAGKFAIESGDVIEAVKRSGAAFSTAGGNLNEFLALFTSVRQTTRQSAESIATGFNTIFTRLERPKTIDFLKKINVQLLEGGKFVGPYEAVKRLSAGLSELDTKDPKFSQIGELLGGYRQLPKLIPLLKEFGLAQEAYNVALTSTGSLTKDAVTSQESFYRQLIKIKEAFLELIRELGENKTLQTIGQFFLDGAKYAIQFARAIEPLAPALAALAAVSLARVGGGALRGVIRGGRFASGGVVPGQGNGDTVPAMLTPGEFVINKKSAQAIGYGKLGQINKYATGGRVRPKGVSNYERDNRYLDYGKIEDMRSKRAMSVFDENDESFSERYSIREKDAYNKIDSVLRQVDISNGDTLLGKSLSRYGTHPGFVNINKAFREGTQGLDKEDVDSAIRIQKGLVNNKLPYNLVLYRGLTRDFADRHQDIDFNSKDAIGKTFKERGLISTSLDPSVTRMFRQNGMMLKILAPKGLRGASFYGRSFQSEKEILLPSGTGFRVIRPFKDKTLTVQAFAKGGKVGTDSVPAMLTPGEFVINKQAASKLGSSNLHKLNNVQKFANGGPVKMAAGGFTPLPKSVIDGSLSSFGGASTGNLAQLYKQAAEVIKQANPTISALQANQQAMKAINNLLTKYGTNLQVVIDATTGQIVGTKNYVAAQARVTKQLNSMPTPGPSFGSKFLSGAKTVGGKLLNTPGSFTASSAGLIASSLIQGNSSVSAQATQGALGGAAFGSIAGPIGSLGGAALGGLSSFFDAIKGAEIDHFTKSIQSASERVDKFLENKTLQGVQEAFAQVGVQTAGLNQLKSAENTRSGLARGFQGLNTLSFGTLDLTSRGLFGQKSLNDTIQEQKDTLDKQFLPNIINGGTAALRTQIGLAGKKVTPKDLDSETQGRFITLAQQRARFENLTGGNTDVQKELDKLFKEILDPANAAQKQKEVIKRLEELANTISIARDNLEVLADASIGLGREFSFANQRAAKENNALSSALGGPLTGSNGRTKILEGIGKAPRDLVSNAIDSTAKETGIPPEIVSLVKDLDTLERDLPRTVRELIKTNPISDETSGEFLDQVIAKLGITNKDLVSSVKTLFESTFEDLGTEANARKAGFEKLNAESGQAQVQAILGNLKKEDIVGVFVEASKIQEERASQFARVMEKTIEIQGRYNQILSETTDLQFQRDKLENQFNKNPISGLRDNRVFDNVNRLAGTTDPTKIANRLIEAKGQFNRTNVTDVDARGALQQEINRLTQALSDLGDVTKRTQTDFEKLDEAASKTQAVKGLGRNFFGADLQGRFTQLNQFRLINQAKQRGSLDSFSISDQQSIVEGLSGSLGTLFPKLLDQLIGNTGGIGKIFAEAQAKFAGEEKAIQDRILATYDSVIKVNEELARIQSTEVDSLNKLANILDTKIYNILQEIVANRAVPVAKAKGGFISRGTDTVPAMLTPGEYVVNAKSAQKNAGILNQINYRAAGGFALRSFTLRRKNEKQLRNQEEQDAAGNRIRNRGSAIRDQFERTGMIGSTVESDERRKQAIQDIEFQKNQGARGTNLPVRQRNTELSPRQKALGIVAQKREADRQARREERIQGRQAIQDDRARARGENLPARNIPGKPAQNLPAGFSAATQKPLGGFAVGQPSGNSGGFNIDGFSKIVDNFTAAVNKLNGLEINLKVQDIKVDLTGGEIIKGLEAGLKQVVGNAIIDKINTELVGTDGKKMSKFGQA